MHIELATLRSLEREKDIPFDELTEIIEQAIHSAYLRHMANLGEVIPEDEQVRVTLDRKTGDILVYAPNLTPTRTLLVRRLSQPMNSGALRQQLQNR
jgi:N utilization substance protein A